MVANAPANAPPDKYYEPTSQSKEEADALEEGKLPDDGDYLELERFGKFTEKRAMGQVTIRLPLNFHPLTIIALLYGFLPWVIPISFGVFAIYTWVIVGHPRFFALYGVCISIILAIINEGILKRIFKDPRPRQSANKEEDGKTMKHGMPSGHVLNAQALMVWAVQEVVISGPGTNAALTWEWVVLILLVMAPVPWARWYNMDHSGKQCCASILLGTVVGTIAFLIRWNYFPNHHKPWIFWADEPGVNYG